jgi:hypothetical protein
MRGDSGESEDLDGPGAGSQPVAPGWHFCHAEDRDGSPTFTSIRQVPDSEMDRYREAVTLLLERQSDRSLEYVAANFADLRNAEAQLALQVATSHSTSALDYAPAVTVLGRLITNWLNSFRMFDDHTNARLTRRFGKNSAQLQRYEKARADIFDSNPSYRFMSKLRDYAQHVGRVPLQATMNATMQDMSLRLYTGFVGRVSRRSGRGSRHPCPRRM